MSSALSVSDTLSGYLAGRVTAAELTAVVAGEYYRETRNGKRETLRPIMDVVERAHPGVVELSASSERPGFAVKLAERPFPKRLEPQLRSAVEQVANTFPVSRVPLPEPTPKRGLLSRILAAIRRVFQ